MSGILITMTFSFIVTFVLKIIPSNEGKSILILKFLVTLKSYECEQYLVITKFLNWKGPFRSPIPSSYIMLFGKSVIFRPSYNKCRTELVHYEKTMSEGETTLLLAIHRCLNTWVYPVLPG